MSMAALAAEHRAAGRIMVELTVVLGKTEMPIKQLLKMGRGAVIDLDSHHSADCSVFANGELIAQGEIVILNDNIGLKITKMISTQDL